MAKKKISNAALIEKLKPAEPIPYDPELMAALADSHQREWQKLETLRRDVYRRVLPNIWREKLDAELAGDAELIKSIELRADREWSEITRAPAIDSWESLAIVMATVVAAGYPETDVGLHAWTIWKASETTEDGPFGLHQWRHNGELANGTMQPGAWNLCNHLWQRPGRTASFDDLYEVATGDREETQFDFKSAGQKAKQFFDANGIAWRLSVSEKSHMVSLVPREK